MKVDTADQLQVLTRERNRLAETLELKPGWRALKELAAREARGEWVDGAERATERKSLEAALSVDRVYLAWKKLGEVIDLLEPTTPAPLIASEPVVLPRPVRGAENVPEPRLAAAEGATGASPLMCIVGMDEETAGRLAGAGVATLAQVAAFTAADVKALRKQLGLGRRLSQQGWIEQAALLARRDADEAVAAASARTTVAPAVSTVALPGVDPPPGDVSTASPEVTKPVPSARPLATSPRPASLTARLFERTPITSPQRSLLSAIEAAEQARLRPSPVASEAIEFEPAAAETEIVFADPPSSSAPLPSDDTPAHGPSEDLDVAGSAVVEPRGRAPRSDRHDKSGTARLPVSGERPVVAPIEDEAEVAIVKRSGNGARRPSRSRPPAASEDRTDAILFVDHEAQGGEDYDPRSVAAFRGAIEEASVEIVVRRSSQRAPSGEGGSAETKPAGRSAGRASGPSGGKAGAGTS